MKKLIKKHQLGGIADWVDTKLDSLGNWGKLGAQLADPTGITGWKDLKDSYNDFQQKHSWASAGALGIAALAAVPMMGYVGKAGRFVKEAEAIGDIAKGINTASDAARGFSKATRAVTMTAKEASQFFDPDVVKVIKEIDNPHIGEVAQYFSTEQVKAAQTILDSEIKSVYRWMHSKGMSSLPPSMQEKVRKLSERKRIIASTPRPILDKRIKQLDTSMQKRQFDIDAYPEMEHTRKLEELRLLQNKKSDILNLLKTRQKEVIASLGI